MQKTSQKGCRAEIAVSNASPLIALKHAGLIEKLNSLFQRVVVPPAVMRELSVKEEEYFRSLPFLQVEQPRNHVGVSVLETVVDEGEAEAIILALEKDAILIINDLKGRKVARRLGLSVIGTLGLLKLMKLCGLVEAVKPYVDKLVSAGFYVSDQLVKRLLSDVGELWGWALR